MRQQAVDQALHQILSQIPQRPTIGVVLGSGLSEIADSITEKITIPYHTIPHFLTPSTQGHPGQIIAGKINGVTVVLLQGRLHLYEGHSIEEIVFPIRVLCRLGIHHLILTNAAGGIAPEFKPGDLMFIQDHLNLIHQNPLQGAQGTTFGSRFTDLTYAYDPSALDLLKKTGNKLGLSYHTGVYAAVLGPSYETPAEVKMLRTLGADAVGMSTVPECICANQFGTHVTGISCITNQAAGLSSQRLSHQEVLENSKKGAQHMIQLLLEFIPALQLAWQKEHSQQLQKDPT